MERWGLIEGYPSYEVSDAGNVRSHRVYRSNPTGAVRSLKAYPNTFGHLTVKLYNGPDDHRQFMVHTLVMHAFAGPRPDGQPDIRHLDGDPTNNVLSNLSYGTHAQNARDMVEHGRGWAGHTHCVNGHEFTPGNTYAYQRYGRPRRGCRTCIRARDSRSSKNRAMAQAERV